MTKLSEKELEYLIRLVVHDQQTYPHNISSDSSKKSWCEHMNFTGLLVRKLSHLGNEVRNDCRNNNRY